jgi:hypothetical protein
MLRGDEVWCQLFSEPGAGSDLASLSTRAVPDGDEMVVSGQKVWTSSAHFSDWAILLARTSTEERPQAGITYLLVDMASPGIDVRPIRQITGSSHFNEVFLTDVRIPVTNVVGGIGEGWKVAMSTLTSERTFIGTTASGLSSFEGLCVLATERGLTDCPMVRQDLARAYQRSQILHYLGWRVQTAISRGPRARCSSSPWAATWLPPPTCTWRWPARPPPSSTTPTHCQRRRRRVSSASGRRAWEEAPSRSRPTSWESGSSASRGTPLPDHAEPPPTLSRRRPEPPTTTT